MQDDLQALLLGDGRVTAFVDEAVFWDAVPPDASLPLIFMRAGPTLPYRLDDDFVETAVEIDMRAASIVGSRDLARAVGLYLSNVAGVQGATEFLTFFKLGAESSSNRNQAGSSYHLVRATYRVVHRMHVQESTGEHHGNHQGQ